MTEIQVWGGPLDGEVYSLPGRPETVYIAESVDPVAEDYYDDEIRDPFGPQIITWELPVKLDAAGIRYPLKAWWDDRVRYA
jgi:hypothetical protein